MILLMADDDKVKDVKDGVNVLKMLNHSDQTILKVDINISR